MKVSIEVKTENLRPNRYRVAGVRPDGTEDFCFGGFWSSSAAEQKAEDYLHGINPAVTIQWDPKPGAEKVGEVLYRGFVFLPDSPEVEEISE